MGHSKPKKSLLQQVKEALDSKLAISSLTRAARIRTLWTFPAISKKITAMGH